ncbi:hypothetical protein WA588_003061 [Blastocystis sp. NMH]
MSSVVAMNDMKLNNGDLEKSISTDGGNTPAGTTTSLRPFGDNPSASNMQVQSRADSNYLGSELGFTDSLNGYSIGPFNDGPSADGDSYYGSMLSHNYPGFSQSQRNNSLSPFSNTGNEDGHLYARHSLGSVFGYGENTMEPFSGRNDLSLTNLQDVMEDDLFGSPSSGNAGASLNPMGNTSLNSMGNTSLNVMSNTSLNPMSSASLNPSSSLSSKPVLGGNSSLFPSNDQLNTFGSMNSLVRKDLSPTLGTLPRLNPSNNSFMLGSFDTDDYGHYPPTLSPQSRAGAFAPAGSLYMNDFLSDAGYSPRPQLSPISSPYAESDLSPRRMYSQPRLLSANEPRLQRTLSAMTPSSSGSLEMPMNFHGQGSFKRKESLKSSAWQNGDIESYRGHIREMSRDHNGCRALQQCLDEHPEKVVDMIYDEVGNELTELMMDSFGNYLFQKLLDVSTPKQRREVLKKVKSHIVDASYNVHGTRSVQRLIQVCNEPDMVKDIMDALRGNIASLSSHSNGNHVIQRCLQHMPDEYRVDVFEEVVKSCMEISTHRHGCCVVQRCLDSAPKKYHDMLLNAIVEHSVELICNPFGNYVIQYLIEKGEPSESERITRCVLGKVSELSRQKYSSNVIEKILTCAKPAVRGEIVNEIATSPNLRELLHDKFANYVIQKALKLGDKQQQQQLLQAIRPYEEELSKSTGGRHILSQLNEIAPPNSQNWNRM